MLDERSFGHVKSQESTFVYRMYTGNDVWVGERVHITQKTNTRTSRYSDIRHFTVWHCGLTQPTSSLLPYKYCSYVVTCLIIPLLLLS